MKEVKAAILLTLLVVTYTEGNTGIDMSSNDRYFNVVVSFWKKDPKAKKLEMLCVGALIRSNAIFSTVQCADTLIPHEEIAVQTGTMKLNEIDPDYILGRTRKLPSKSKFAIVILNQEIELLLTLKLDFVDESDYGGHDTVIVGWQDEEGPRTEPITIKINNKMSLFPTDYNYGYIKFPPGSFVVEETAIIGFTDLNPSGRMIFHKLLIKDMSYLKKSFQGGVEPYTEQERAIEIEEAQISDETYLDTIVAFCKTTHEILCIGVIIEPDCIMTIRSCGQRLERLGEFIVLTRTRYLKHNFTLTGLDRTSLLHPHSKFCLVYLSESIELLQPLQIEWMAKMKGVSNGVMVEWMKQEGPVITRNAIFNAQYRIWAKTHGTFCDYKSLPFGSFIAKGKTIIGFVEVDEHDVATFNKLTYMDRKVLKRSFKKINQALKRGASVFQDFPPSKKSQHQM